MMTVEEQQELRDLRLSEVGMMPSCPFCQRPRVKRSDYTRCNLCGVNWLDGENLNRDPRIERKATMMATVFSHAVRKAGAQTAPSSSEGG